MRLAQHDVQLSRIVQSALRILIRSDPDSQDVRRDQDRLAQIGIDRPRQGWRWRKPLPGAGRIATVTLLREILGWRRRLKPPIEVLRDGPATGGFRIALATELRVIATARQEDEHHRHHAGPNLSADVSHSQSSFLTRTRHCPTERPRFGRTWPRISSAERCPSTRVPFGK